MKRIILLFTLALVAFLLWLPAGLYAQTDPFGNALDLDGTNQYVSVPGGTWFNNSFTVEAWVYARSYNNWSRVIEFGNGPNSDNVLCALTAGPSGKPIFQWYNGSTLVGNLTSSVLLPTNTWTHLAFVYNGTSLTQTILMNGVLVAQATGVIPPNIINRTVNYVGRSLYAADAYANATFDDLRIWNVVRTQAQIKAAMGGPLTGNETGLVLYYRFDEASGTLVANSASATGAADNGTNINGALNLTSTTPFFPTLVISNATTAPPPYDPGTANLNASINSGEVPTVAYFQFGYTTSYGATTSTNDFAATNVPVAITVPIGGLSFGTTLHYQLVVSNFFGVTNSPDEVLVFGGYVYSTADSGLGSLRQAVAQTSPGFPIEFAPNLSGQTITLTSGEIVVTNSLTIDASALTNFPVISGNGTSRLFLFTSNATVSINSLILTQGEVTNDFGGAIYNDTGCMLNLSNCVLTGNSSTGSTGANGGSGANGGTGNPAGGGAIYNLGMLTLDHSIVTSNSVIGGVGGVGGGATSFIPPVPVGGDGGAASGGGIYNLGVLTLTASSVANNSADAGVGGAGTVSSQFGSPSGNGGNGGPASGGAIYSGSSSTLNFSNSALYGNIALGGLGGAGGGDTSSIFSIPGNGMNGGLGNGGAIYSLGNLSIISSTLASNTAAGGGGGAGGASQTGGGSGGNGNNAQGGGIVGSGPMTIIASTISANSAIGGRAGLSPIGGFLGIGQGTNGLAGTGSVGGIVSSKSLALHSSIIAGNTGGNTPDLLGTIVSTGYNLLGAADGSAGLINDLNGDMTRSAAAPFNPSLAPLADNGGPTFTMALLPDSPALDAGDDSLTNGFATDQRGDPRLSGGHVDIGAFEFQTAGFSAPAIVSQIVSGFSLDPTTHLGGFTVNASVNPNGLVANVWIEYGYGTTYVHTITPVAIGYGSNDVAIDLPLSGLPPGIPTHFRVVAANDAGTNYGAATDLNVSLIGDFNGDGMVSSSELNEVYGDYLLTSPWLSLTNVAGLGGTNVTFSLNGIPAGNYTVQYSTNLSDWNNLGPVAPEYLFIDTNAPSSPQRYYRLTYP